MGRVGLGFGKGRTKETHLKTVDSVPAAELCGSSLRIPKKNFSSYSIILQNKSNTNMNPSENETALVADFRKVINTLNSSIIPEHLVASQRLWELAERKWKPYTKTDKRVKEMFESFSRVYTSQKRAVANKLEILR
jgi:hypothetical protein